jgi:hypothetical protein
MPGTICATSLKGDTKMKRDSFKARIRPRQPGAGKVNETTIGKLLRDKYKPPVEDVSGTPTSPDVTGEPPEHPRQDSEAPAGREGAACRDDEHEAACANLRNALAGDEGVESQSWQRVLRRGRSIGWPETSVDEAWEGLTGPWGTKFDAASGRGGEGSSFRARLPVSRRYHTELLIDLMISCGIREPSMMVRVLVHRARAAAAMHGDAPAGRELIALADLFERYPSQAVDYAAEWAACFDKRMRSTG